MAKEREELSLHLEPAADTPEGQWLGAGRSTADLLNAALAACHDCSYGCSDSAAHAHTKKGRDLMERLTERYRYDALELRSEIKRLGAEPETGGTASGALHRGWAAVRGALTGHTDADLLAECERAEDALQARYREALLSPLPSDARPMIGHLLRRAERTRRAIHALRAEIVPA